MVASLTYCPLFLFNSHLFRTMYDPSPQQAALYRGSACHFSSPSQWPDCPSILWQDNTNQRKVSKSSEALGKRWMLCEAIPQCLLWEQSSVLPGPENCQLVLTVVLSSAIHMRHCPAATGWSGCEGQLHWVILGFGYCHSLSLGWSRTILNARMLS